MSFRQQRFQQPSFRESLEYDTQFRDQIRVIREAINFGDDRFLDNAVEGLRRMITPDIMDDKWKGDMSKREKNLEEQQQMQLADYYFRTKGSGCSDVIPKPNGRPDREHLLGVYQDTLALLQRKRLLLKQSHRGVLS